MSFSDNAMGAIASYARQQKEKSRQVASEIMEGGVQLMEAIVVSPPPELSIKLRRNDKLQITKEMLTVAEHLTRHERVVTLIHTEAAMRDLGDGRGKDLVSGDGLIFKPSDEREAPHNDISSFRYEYIILRFEDVLKAGDKVLVQRFAGGQKYHIADRIVSYGGDEL